MLKKYLVSYPTIIASILFAFILMLVYYHFQYIFDAKYNSDSYFDMAMRMLPSIVYSFIVIPLNMLYKYLATVLTEWGNWMKLKFIKTNLDLSMDFLFLENHRTQSSFESNLTTKLFIVSFINNYN